MLAARHQNLELYESHAAPAENENPFRIDFGDIRDMTIIQVSSFRLCLEIGLVLTLHILVLPIIGDIEKSWQFFSVLVPGFVYGKCAFRGFFFLF